MIDIAGVLYGMGSPIYDGLAVAATFQKDTVSAAIRVLDYTRRTAEDAGVSADVQTIQPAAIARKVELDGAGIARDDYDGSLLTFNGQAWRITSHEMRGSPQGENAGEVRFILSEA